MTDSTTNWPTSRRRTTPEDPATRTLNEILTSLGIAQWDLLICGDGSGNAWKGGCGWASTLVDNRTRGRLQFVGGMNMGSVNLAEVMPYLHALTWFHANTGKQRLHELGRPMLVHIVTDSQVTVAHGEQTALLDQPLPKHQEPQWAAMRHLVRMGYQLHYHWINRQSTALNWAADLLAGRSRRVILSQPEMTLSAEWLDWARQVQTYCHSQLPHLPQELADHWQKLVYANQLLLNSISSPAQQAAHLIEQVELRDPRTGELLDPYQLDPLV